MAITYKTQFELTDEVILNLIESGLITDFNVGSVNRIIIDSINYSISIDGYEDSIYNQIKFIDESRNIDTSTGVYLEQLGSLVGVQRDVGAESSGIVTFRVNNDLTDNLVIAENTQISTSPNDPDGQKIFVVSENTFFFKTITDETHKFIDGIFNYRLNQRFYQTVSNFTATKGGSVVVLTQNTDFEIDEYEGYLHKIDGDYEIVDTFDATTGWTNNDSAGVSVDTSLEKEGTGCLNVGKSDTGANNFHISKTITEINISAKIPSLWIYIHNTTELNKIKDIVVYLGNSTITNSNQFRILRRNLEVGFKQYFLDFLEKENGIVENTEIDFVRIQFNYFNSGDTTTLGNLKLDFMICSDYEYYRGNVIKIIEAEKPDHDTNMLITYNPRSVEVNCVSEEIGVNQNVSSDKIINKITFSPVMNQINNINNYEKFENGRDLQNDEELRENIKKAAESPGSASLIAIKNSIESLAFVRNVSVIDRPQIEILNEPIVFNSSVDNYRLNVQIPFLDNETTPTNISISNSFGGVANYVYGTDYELSNGEIVWLAGTKPTNGNTFFVNYESRELAKANLIISGLVSFSTTEKQEIETLIEEKKPLGCSITWQEPTITQVNVTVEVTLKDDFTFTTELEQKITNKIFTYINTLNIGEDVIINKIIGEIISINEVLDVNVTAPATNVVIDVLEIAKSGLISVSEI